MTSDFTQSIGMPDWDPKELSWKAGEKNISEAMNRTRLKILNPLWHGVLISVYLFLTACQPVDVTSKVHYLEVGANIWHLERWGNDHLVLADYHGRISLRTIQDNREVWSFETGAFVFDLKSADLNRDGKPEAALVTAQGTLMVLDASGNKLWSFQSMLPLYSVGIGNVAGDEMLEVVCGGIDRYVYVLDANGMLVARSPQVERLVHRLAVGNLDRDAYDEILVIENRTGTLLMEFDQKKLITTWRKPLKVPHEYINWENTAGHFFPFSIDLCDLDGDGVNEILMGDTYFNKQTVMVTDNQANPLWISEGLTPFQQVDGAQIDFYATAFVRGGDLYPEIDGLEVLSVAGGMFRVWDHRGNLLGARNARIGFTDLEIFGREVFLGSAPNGDDHIYRFRVGENWEALVTNLEFKGLTRHIRDNLCDLKIQVENYKADTISGPVYDLKIGFPQMEPNSISLEAYQQQMEWFYRRFPYKNLRLVQSVKAIEETPPLDENGNPWSPWRWNVDAINGTMTVDQIVEKARWIEHHKIPTLFYIGHSCMPFITLETARKILETAPNYCLGFQTSEDEELDLIPRYFTHFYQPLSDLCLKYGNKRNITKNKGLWWFSSPAIPEVYQALFSGARKSVSGAATEDSNSRTPEMNLMARGGLWQAGLLRHNDVSIHADLFSFNRYHQWEYPKTGHPYLRLLVAHTTLGMTEISTRIRDIIPGSDTASFDAIGAESTEIFYHLLGKGIVFSPQREDALGYSPVGLVVHRPPDNWLRDAHNGHTPEKWVDDGALHQAVIPHNGNLWGMTNTSDHALQRVLFNKERQFGSQVPATPYGLVAMVPEYADLKDVAHVHEWWHTDGIHVWKPGGVRLTGVEAANALKADFERAAQRLPFRQEIAHDAVFMQILRVNEGHFRLFLVDPGWINPRAHSVTVKIQMDGVFKARNILSNEGVEISDDTFKVDVPAGLFAIVDVMQVQQSR